MAFIRHNNISIRNEHYAIIVSLGSVAALAAINLWHIEIGLIIFASAVVPLLVLKYNKLPLLLYIFCVVGLDAHHLITFLEVIDFGEKTIFFADIILGLGAIAFLIHYFKHQESFKTSLDIPMMVFFLVACFSLLRGSYYGRSAINEFRPYLYMTSFYFLTTRVLNSSDEVRKVIQVFILSSLLIPFFAIYAHVTQPAVVLKARVGQSGSHSFFMLTTVLFLTIYSIEVGRYRKYFFPVICCLIFLILIGYSRTTYVVSLLTFIALALTYSKQAKNLIRFRFCIDTARFDRSRSTACYG